MGLTCPIGKLNRIHQMAETYIAERLLHDNLPVLRNHLPLFYLLPETGEPIQFLTLVERWGLSKSTISEIVARYEKIGLLSKCVCGEDKRSVYIAMTPEAVQIKRQLEAIEFDFMNQLLESLSMEERELFTDFLDRIIGHCKGCK